MAKNNRKKYSFIFICQRGELEIQSVLLALSLKKYLKCDYELIAAIPTMYGDIYEPGEITIKFLKKLNIRIEYFKNKYCINKTKKKIGDWFSNKAYSLTIPVACEKIIFLDSDILCIRKFKHESRFFNVDFNAKQENQANVKEWNEIYSLFKIDIPKLRVPCSVDRNYLPPYFNSGFFGINKSLAKELCKVWIEVFETITNNNIIKNEIRRNQASLAVAIQKMGITYEMLDNSYNFPARRKTINKKNIPIFAHYHDVETVFRTPVLKNLVVSFINQYEQVGKLIEKNPQWNKIFNGSLLYKKTFKLRIFMKNKVLPTGIKKLYKKLR